MIKFVCCLLLVSVFLASTMPEDLESVSPCGLCHVVVTVVQYSFPKEPIEGILDRIGTIYCTQKHLQNHNVCKGAVSEMVDSIFNSLWRHFTDPHSVCHKMKICPKEYVFRDLKTDIANILKGKPTGKEWEPATNRKSLKVLHISDLHPDLYYTAGAPSKCSEPVCCRSNVTLAIPFYQLIAKINS